MEKKEIFDRLSRERFIPLIRASSTDDAVNIAHAIKEGGAGFIEVTMTVPGAFEAIKELIKTFGDDPIIGAGTVLDAETARMALVIGAKFIVTPTVNIDVIHMAHRYSTLVIIGAMTLTEILNAWNAGADLVKVFPVSLLGGPNYVKAIRGPLPQVLLVPSGGINAESAGAYIEVGATAIAVGSELVDKKAVKEKRFDIITENTKAFLKAVKAIQSNK